eukprot:Platyproteum_vivax@DN7591_c3_g1_i3.p2
MRSKLFVVQKQMQESEYECPECNTKLEGLKSFIEHMKKEHPTPENPNPKGMAYNCETCRFGTNNWRTFNQHRKTHIKKVHPTKPNAKNPNPKGMAHNCKKCDFGTNNRRTFNQ